jgi:hypothetical protein
MTFCIGDTVMVSVIYAVSLMLAVINKLTMFSVMMMSILMLNVTMTNVVAPIKILKKHCRYL